MNKSIFRFCLTMLVIALLAFHVTAQNNCSKVKLTAEHLKETGTKKVLLLIADDRSGSISSPSQPRRMTEAEYRSLLQVFIDKGYKGQFALRLIGNAGYTGFESSVSVAGLYDIIPIPDNALLSERAKLRCLNFHIQDTCNGIKLNNQKKIDAYVSDIIRSKALNYKPSGPDKTDIDLAFRDIEMKLNANEHMGYDKIIVLIMSDGIDSNHSNNLTIKSKQPFEVLLLGWPKTKSVKDKNDKHFDSADEIINWFKNTKI